MSYDIGIIVDGHVIDGDDIWLEDFAGDQHANHTSNAWRSYAVAIPAGALYELDEMPCSDAAEQLAAGVEHMEKNEVQHRELEPSNGWGSYESALQYLRFALALCRTFPSARFYVSH